MNKDSADTSLSNQDRSYYSINQPEDHDYQHLHLSEHETRESSKQSMSPLINGVPEQDTDRTKAPGIPEEPLTWKERAKRTLIALTPLFVMLIFDVGLPLLIYYVLRMYIGELIALILSGIPPLLRVFYIFIRHRRVYTLGIVFVISFIVSAIISIITGNPRDAVLRDSATTALVGILFLITLIPFRIDVRIPCSKREDRFVFANLPLIYITAVQIMATLFPDVEWVDLEGQYHRQSRVEWLWEYYHGFRTYCRVLTFLWGFFLLLEFAIRLIMVLATNMTVDQIVYNGTIVVVAVSVFMTVVTIASNRYMRKGAIEFTKQWMKENARQDGEAMGNDKP